MSRLTRAWAALTQPAEATHSAVSTSPRSRGDISPYRTVNRDRAIEATNAPPAARQVWQLHRVREESRDLELRSAIWGGYVRFSRIQTIGYELSRLQFDRLTKEQQARLGEVIRYLRREWRRFQTLPTVGGGGQNIHQMAGQVLHHVDVDGDCFLRPRRAMGMRVWDLYPGDALAEAESTQALGGRENTQLGVVTDKHGKPVAYLFGEGGHTRFQWSFAPYASSVKAERVPAERVRHIRDRSGESTAVRGWPRCTTVIELIARADEWFEALSRSAVLRAAVGIALKQDAMFGAPQDLSGRAPGDRIQSVGEQTIGQSADQFGGGDVRPYQEFASKAGTIMELDPGYEVQNITTGSPTGQEAEAIAMVLRLIAAGLRTSPATLYGDYGSLSFSAGQLAHIQERQAIEDRQMVLCGQFYQPIYRDWLLGKWQGVVGEFPEIDPMADLDPLLYPAIKLKKYQILDKGRLVKPLLEAWNQGIYTYAEVREELGEMAENADEIIEQWKADRAALGLPESPQQGGGMMPGESDDDDEDDQDDDPDEDK